MSPLFLYFLQYADFCNKKRAIFWLFFLHYRMAATIAKASMAIKATTPPATIANVSFFIFFSFFRFLYILHKIPGKSNKKEPG